MGMVDRGQLCAAWRPNNQARATRSFLWEIKSQFFFYKHVLKTKNKTWTNIISLFSNYQFNLILIFSFLISMATKWRSININFPQTR